MSSKSSLQNSFSHSAVIQQPGRSPSHDDSAKRKVSSELRDAGAGNLFLIKVQWCLHYEGSVVFTLGDWGG